MSRRLKIQENLDAKGLITEEAHRPYRTIVTTNHEVKEYGILADSIAFGVFLDKAMTVSCPGANLESLASDNILKDFQKRGVTKLAICGGTNNLVKKNKSVTDVVDITPGLEALVTKYKEAGFNVVVVKVTGRAGHKEEIKELNKAFRKMAKTLNVESHNSRKFSTKYLCEDGLHPDPDEIHRLSRDFYDALSKLC